MDDQDDYLCQEETLRHLIEVVQQTPRDRRAWKDAMHQLLCYIPSKLTRCSHPSYPDVLNETLRLICEQIQEFEFRSDSVTSSFIAWVHNKLRHKYRILDLNRESSNLSLDGRVTAESGTTFIDQLADSRPNTIWDLDAEIERLQRQETNERIGRRLWRYIEQDPDKRLRSCASRKYPHCNCQEVALRRYLKTPPQSLPQIAKALEVPYQTLMSQWKTNFQPLLQTLAIEFGYSPNQDL